VLECASPLQADVCRPADRAGAQHLRSREVFARPRLAAYFRWYQGGMNEGFARYEDREDE
jgi:hypothetical protein